MLLPRTWLVVLGVLAGCGARPVEAPGDMPLIVDGREVEAAAAPEPDLARKVDLSWPDLSSPDLTREVDLSSPDLSWPDLTREVDLSTADLRLPPDLEGCHWDCFGYLLCKNGEVIESIHAPVPCEFWTGQCPRMKVFTCPAGCRKEGEISHVWEMKKAQELCAPTDGGTDQTPGG